VLVARPESRLHWCSQPQAPAQQIDNAMNVGTVLVEAVQLQRAMCKWYMEVLPARCSKLHTSHTSFLSPACCCSVLTKAADCTAPAFDTKMPASAQMRMLGWSR
jgi:hypothetical protein